MTSEREPIFLSIEEVLAFHDEQLRLYGGSAGVHDMGALESAVATPAATFDQAFLHEDVFHMAAAYVFHIAENQPFVDGNKRTAVDTALVFLGLNGFLLVDPDGRLYDAVIALSSHELHKQGLAVLMRELAVPSRIAEED